MFPLSDIGADHRQKVDFSFGHLFQRVKLAYCGLQLIFEQLKIDLEYCHGPGP